MLQDFEALPTMGGGVGDNEDPLSPSSIMQPAGKPLETAPTSPAGGRGKKWGKVHLGIKAARAVFLRYLLPAPHTVCLFTVGRGGLHAIWPGECPLTEALRAATG